MARNRPVGHAVLDDLVSGPSRSRAVQDVWTYFDSAAGRRFERLGGGGDRDGVADEITPADVLAVTALSGWRTGPAVLALLAESQRHEELRHLLARIPHDPLHAVGPEVIGPQSAARRAWDVLTQVGGVDRVFSGKLLARKRPHLLPVPDLVVWDALGRPPDHWALLHDWFHDDPARAGRVESLRADVGDVDDISLLRCLDVALWMRARRAPRPGARART
jgi:hypothetical protein